MTKPFVVTTGKETLSKHKTMRGAIAAACFRRREQDCCVFVVDEKGRVVFKTDYSGEEFKVKPVTRADSES
jgi:hypothetical protein